MHANVRFKTISWNETLFDELEDGPKLTQTHIKRFFEW